MRYLLLCTGLVGLLNTFFLIVSMYLCVKMVSPSVIMTYANDRSSSMLLLPAFGCMGLSIYLLSHSNYSISHYWMGAVFMVVAVLTFSNALLGFLGGRYKKRRALLVYVGINFLSIIILVILCIMGYVYSTDWSTRTMPSGFSQKMACAASLIGCCCCHENIVDMCPEWSRKEISYIMAADFRIAGLTALLSILYEGGGLFTGYLLFENLREYFCGYI